MLKRKREPFHHATPCHVFIIYNICSEHRMSSCFRARPECQRNTLTSHFRRVSILTGASPSEANALSQKVISQPPGVESSLKGMALFKKPRHLQPRIRMFLCGVQLAGLEKDPGSSLGCQKLNLSFKTWHRT